MPERASTAIWEGDIMGGKGVRPGPLAELYEEINKLPTTTAGAYFMYDGIS